MQATIERRAPRHANGELWKEALGRSAPRDSVELHFTSEYAIIQLTASTQPGELLRAAVRELKIRFYTSSTRRSYVSALRGFLRFYRGSLADVSQEDVCEYLLLLVDGGAAFAVSDDSLSRVNDEA